MIDLDRLERALADAGPGESNYGDEAIVLFSAKSWSEPWERTDLILAAATAWLKLERATERT